MNKYAFFEMRPVLSVGLPIQLIVQTIWVIYLLAEHVITSIF